MTAHVVGYDKSPGVDYDALYKALKAYDDWWWDLESTWVIITTKSAGEVRDELRPHLHKNDKLLVVKSSGAGAWTGFGTDPSKWLKDNL